MSLRRRSRPRAAIGLPYWVRSSAAPRPYAVEATGPKTRDHGPGKSSCPAGAAGASLFWRGCGQAPAPACGARAAEPWNSACSKAILTAAMRWVLCCAQVRRSCPQNFVRRTCRRAATRMCNTGRRLVTPVQHRARTGTERGGAPQQTITVGPKEHHGDGVPTKQVNHTHEPLNTSTTLAAHGGVPSKRGVAGWQRAHVVSNGRCMPQRK